LVLFRSRSDRGEVSSPLSARLLSIRPVELFIINVFVFSFGSSSLADEFLLLVTEVIGPFTISSIHSDTVTGINSGFLRLTLSPVVEFSRHIRGPCEFTFFLEVVVTDPSGSSVGLEGF
jgi:hypothetical protein